MRAWVAAVLALGVVCAAVAARRTAGGAADRRVTIELSVFNMPWKNALRIA